MSATDHALHVLALPFAAFVILAVLPWLRRKGRAAGWLSIIAVAVAPSRALTVWAGGGPGGAPWAWVPADGRALSAGGGPGGATAAAMLGSGAPGLPPG